MRKLLPYQFDVPLPLVQNSYHFYVFMPLISKITSMTLDNEKLPPEALFIDSSFVSNPFCTLA